MEEESQSPWAISRGQVVVLAAILFWVVSMITDPFGVNIKKQRKAADRTEALNNIKQISAMLYQFQADYGRLPDDETALEVKRRTNTDFVLTGQYSNDYFRQLLVGPDGRSERVFWSKTAQSPKKPDDDFSTPAKALAAGEVGFSYIMASPTKGQSIDKKVSEEGNRPVVVTPSYEFRADWTFDPEPYAGKAVVLRLDNSATPMQIRENDKEVSTGIAGKTLGDVGDGTVWGSGMTPFLRAPQPRAGGK